LTCNIKVVGGAHEAIDQIVDYGSRHTDVIVTDSYEVARHFLSHVDSSSVMVNASSRLADGSVYGLGAEIGISTDKLHAYGPMGVQELTSKKFVVWGNGTLRT
jgi:glutamate-5-semialdehyde dehydrogenase